MFRHGRRYWDNWWKEFCRKHPQRGIWYYGWLPQQPESIGEVLFRLESRVYDASASVTAALEYDWQFVINMPNVEVAIKIDPTNTAHVERAKRAIESWLEIAKLGDGVGTGPVYEMEDVGF